jgi:hypothetical protein
MAERDCQKCKRYKGCPGKWYSYTENGRRVEEEWYHYGEIRWCPQQDIWILDHAELLRSGQWVFRHEESGESRRLSAEAYFVQAGIAIAELDERLESTPNKGELLLTQIEDGRTLGNLSPGAYEILMYIKGKPRKPQDFSVWKAKRDYRQKGYKTIP